MGKLGTIGEGPDLDIHGLDRHVFVGELPGRPDVRRRLGEVANRSAIEVELDQLPQSGGEDHHSREPSLFSEGDSGEN